MWLSLCFPMLPLEIFSRGSALAEPLVVTQGQGVQQQVIACNKSAQDAGIVGGMRLSAAYALAPHVQIKKRDERLELAALTQVASWAGQFTSLLNVAPPGAVLLEVGGSLMLFKGAEALAALVRQGLSELGYSVQTAIAPTPLGALLLAQLSTGTVITEQRLFARALAKVPLSLLEVPPATLMALEKLGLSTIGDCSRLPRDGLARRFGPQLLSYLDKALGTIPDPRKAFIPPAEFSSQLNLPADVSHTEELLFAARRLILELAGFLRARQSGVQHITLDLLHTHERYTRLPLHLVTPTRNAQHLLDLLRVRLDTLQLSAPVTAIRVDATQISALAPTSMQLLTNAEAKMAEWPALIERLRARLGYDAVQGILTLPGHRPELAWQYCSPNESNSNTDNRPRPVWLLPKPILLQQQNNRPVLSGKLSGRLIIEKGPERIESGWWDGDDVQRDYFVAKNNAGARYWIFRNQPSKQWFLQGIFS